MRKIKKSKVLLGYCPDYPVIIKQKVFLKSQKIFCLNIVEGRLY